MSVWQEWIGKSSLLDTLKKARRFGNILMKIPNDFINEAQPAQSKFIYVGLDSEDRELTSQYLKTANYYVAKADYGAVGNYAISDSNFPGKMLHLNTGLVFLGDGNAANPEEPALPLLVPDAQGGSKETLKSAVESLVKGVSEGESSKSTEMAGLEEGSAGYSGNKIIGTLFSVPAKSGELAYPPIMQGAISALENGTSFGPFKLRGFAQLSDDAMKDLSAALNQPPPPMASKEPVPYIAQGIYIYQTQDTPFIKMVLDRISPEDPDAAILHKSLVDYVVIQSRRDNYKQVPLEVPVPTLDKGHFATYALNPDAPTEFYVRSLLDPTGFYDFKGQKFSTNGIPAPDEGKQTDINRQIDLVKKYIENKLKYGPFVYGSAQMLIDEALSNEGVYVYRIPGFLEGGEKMIMLLDLNGAKLECRLRRFQVNKYNCL